ncbi:MAG TPA: uroporphyrinogen decarboxylase family protein [Sedimentisphaerales bacterium]|nr:uroporphyrinogen decarboxylase family protein [Sedimentisphaerales bacterium]
MAAKMPARERFYTALSGGLPDRVPTLPKIWVDLGAALTGVDLREVVENSETAMRVVVEAALLVKADGARLFHLPNRQTKLENGSVVEVDKSGEVLGPVDMQGGLATRVRDKSRINLEDPYQAAMIQFYKADEPVINTVEDVRRVVVPDKSFYEQIGFGTLQRELMQKVGDGIALLGDCGSATLAFHVLCRELSLALMDLLENPKLTHAIMAKGVEHAVEKGKFHIDCGLRMLRLNDSIANMSVISPQHFREFILPHMKMVCDELHHYEPDVRIYCHVCGNVMPIMEDLIAASLDCVGPLDPLGGFTCAQARQAIGDRIALMGGVNTLSFINSTPQQLIDEARICIEGAGRSGYILGSGCVVPRAARKENLLALYEAAERFGGERTE